MRTTIDRAGRIVIPKELRDRLALSGGEEVEVVEVDGRIEIARPQHDEPLIESGGIMTFRSGPGLGPEEVRELLERTRR